MAFFTNDPELSVLKDRLIKNQRDIGDVFGKYYGANVKKDVTGLLLQHITIAVDVLVSIKENNKQNQVKSISAFYANAADIGKYLDNLIGTKNMFQNHLHDHITTLYNSIVAYITKKYVDDTNLFDEYVSSGLQMAIDLGHNVQ